MWVNKDSIEPILGAKRVNLVCSRCARKAAHKLVRKRSRKCLELVSLRIPLWTTRTLYWMVCPACGNASIEIEKARAVQMCQDDQGDDAPSS